MNAEFEDPSRGVRGYSVRYGRTARAGEFESLRFDLECQFDVDKVKVEEGKEYVRTQVETWVDAAKNCTGVTPNPRMGYPFASPATPDILDTLGWKPYREGHRAGWIFADKAPPGLVMALEREGKPVVSGKFCYRFSGPEENRRLFISRTPLEDEAKGDPCRERLLDGTTANSGKA